MVTNIMVGIPSFVVMFCRFFFARYVHGLVTDKKLFKQLICVSLLFFSLHWLGIFPVQLNLNEELSIKRNIKGRICTQTHILEFLEETVNVLLSVKPKLIIISLILFIFFFNTYFYVSAIRQRARHHIPRKRVNLMDIKGNFLVPLGQSKLHS